MNINEKLIKLKQETGYPVCQDFYEGKEERYITFTYEDERAALYGDNEELAETAYLQVSFYFPEDFNYFEDKKKIKKALKKEGFNVESIQTWLEDAKTGTKKIRRILFIVNITMEAEEN